MPPPEKNESPQKYSVWKLRFNLAMQDPDTVGTRYHTGIFVETNSDKSGVKYHVVGDITSGMTYQKISCDEPDGSLEDFHSKELLGYTASPLQWDSLLGSIPPPGKQKAFNIKTMTTELVKSWEPLTFYGPGEARPPPFKCTEWTEQRALPALEKAGLLERLGAGFSEYEESNLIE